MLRLKIAMLALMLAASGVTAQTNSAASGGLSGVAFQPSALAVQIDASQGLSLAERVEAVRAVCIQKRRLICGRILKVLPEGLIVDSGYTNLMRAPLNQSWLVPGTAKAARATGLVEYNQPDAVCVGLVFLTDLPAARGAKPKVFDCVNLEGFPMGEYTYTSVGSLHRTVRRFTTKVANSVRWNFTQSTSPSPPAK